MRTVMVLVEAAAPKSDALTIFSACVCVFAQPAGAAAVVAMRVPAPLCGIFEPTGGIADEPPCWEHDAVTMPAAAANTAAKFLFIDSSSATRVRRATQRATYRKLGRAMASRGTLRCGCHGDIASR